MISFVNAKINLGLNITRRRPDGYHDLSTIFYPVGGTAGTPVDPSPFCDILEITDASAEEFVFLGNHIDCPLEKNLVVKGYQAFYRELGRECPKRVILEKHLPDGAGMGGGSADASFVLRMLNEMEGNPFSDDDLERIALTLGADCPVFIRNISAYAEGVGELLTPLEIPAMHGKWVLIVKPDLYISTKEAFAGVIPSIPTQDLREIITTVPIEEWRGNITNDFEDSLFPHHPELPALKKALYEQGALFALMTGSGAALYGIFPDKKSAENALAAIPAPYKCILSC